MEIISMGFAIRIRLYYKEYRKGPLNVNAEALSRIIPHMEVSTNAVDLDLDKYGTQFTIKNLN